MEFLEHGELFHLVQKMRGLSPNLTRFYASQVVLVLEYLHKENFVYRDLKPENILLQRNGYMKITDFGFCKKLRPGERTNTFCGTPEYIAPEVILYKGHGKPVDWYCLGILIFELMTGRCPFMDSDPMKLFTKILENPIPFPKNFDAEAKSLIRHLTNHDLSRRYGNMKKGVKDIKNHRFFKGINWADIEKMKTPSPVIPEETFNGH